MSIPANPIRDYLAAGDAGDDDRLRDLVDPHIVTHTPGDVVVHGIEDLLAIWRVARAGLVELRHQVLAEIRTADYAAARVRAGGIHRGEFLGVAATGRRIEVDQALFANFAGGLIVELWEVVDTGFGLQQLGALPQRQALAPAEPRLDSLGPEDDRAI